MTSHQYQTYQPLPLLAKMGEDERRILLHQLEDQQPVTVPLRFRVAWSRLPNRADVLRKLGSCCGGEGAKYESYVEAALRLPLGVYGAPPDAANVPVFLEAARATMDAEIYGQAPLKDQTVRALCSWATNPTMGRRIRRRRGGAASRT